MRANESFRYDVAVRAMGNSREAVLSSRIAGVSSIAFRVPLPDGPVTLEVIASARAYTSRAAAGAGSRTVVA